MVTGLNVDWTAPRLTQCEVCIRGKQMVAPYLKESETKVEEIGDLIVLDTWGPSPVPGINGERYAWAFTDLRARHTTEAFGKERTEILGNFREYHTRLSNQHGVKIKRVRFDNAKEFVDGPFRQYLRDNGIEVDTTAPESSAQNGVAERSFRTLLDHVRALLIAANLPKSLWPLAFAHAVYLKNRLPTKALRDVVPEEVWTGKKPDLSDLQPWGCKCWVLTSATRRSKLDPKSEPMHFVGIPRNSKAWLFYDPRSRRVGKSRNIIFQVRKPAAPPPDDDDFEYAEIPFPSLEGENDSPSDEHQENDSAGTTTGPTEGTFPPRRPAEDVPKASGTPAPGGVDDITTEPHAPEATTSIPENAHPPPRRSTRTTVRWDYKRMNSQGRDGQEARAEAPNEAHIACILSLIGTESAHEPRNLREAEMQPEWPEWSRAMDDEYAQLTKLGVFEPSELPAGRKAIGCRWVYRIKYNSEGRIVRFKARLVAQGFSQVPVLDYFETFAPVIQMDSLRTMFAITVEHGLKMRQLMWLEPT